MPFYSIEFFGLNSSDIKVKPESEFVDDVCEVSLRTYIPHLLGINIE